ncbi:MAG: thioredoxin family protein [archaeon]|nr:thioredoxin family protein [archaeon]
MYKSNDSLVLDITDENSEDYIKSEEHLLIDCWAPWCKQCTQLNLIIEGVAKISRNEIAIGKLNVDNNVKTSKKFGIKSIPSILIFKNGKLENIFVGFNSSWTPENLKSLILEH